MSLSYPLGEIAFYWRMRGKTDAAALVPEVLPFEFGFERTLQLVIQRRDPVVLDCLHRVYQQDANVGYLQEGHALATAYGDDFLRFISTHRPAGAAPSALEIGCGGAYLLKKLQDQGWRVRGVDPSPVAKASAERMGIELVEGFYPAGQELGCHDAILHYDVLEHTEDPVAFLKAHHADLARGGTLLFAVPDCTENIRRGDISMILHEHLNYFDQDSLRRTVEAAGFAVNTIEPSRHGGVLYCAAHPATCSSLDAGDDAKFRDYVERAGQATQRLGAKIQAVLANPEASLGFYVPLRAIPYLSTLRAFEGFRFFDDDPGIHGKYFDGFDIPVENHEDLAAKPVTHLIVASFSFGEVIARKVREHVNTPVEILSLADFME